MSTSEHFQRIYAHQADQYDALVAREDYQGKIQPALTGVKPLDGLEVVEFGAGTGRLTKLLAPQVKSIRAFDGSAHMLDVLIARLQESGFNNWEAAVADNRALPSEDSSADVAIEGWSFSNFCSLYPDTWREEIGHCVAEMKRVLRPAGTAIIIETMGTGRESPQPPHAGLAAYYAWLENEHGFTYTWIRTDYRFESLEEAERLTRFFFGDELADEVLRNQWVILPECTGIWWLNI